MKLQDRVAIVTGSAQGIGRAVAQKLSDEGAKVVLADINGPGAEKAASELPGARRADGRRVGRRRRPAHGRRDDVSRHGKVDVLVNVAAIVPFTAWDDITFEEWRRIMSVNLDGVFLTIKAVETPMREAGYGRIVNIASNVVLAGTPNLAHYVASKGGVWSFTRAAARELGKYGITVNSVAPGLTASEGVLASPHAEAFEFVQMLQAIPRRGHARRHRPGRRLPGLGGGRLGDGPDDRRRRRAHAQLMAGFPVTRAGAILAVSDFEASLAFYRDRLGLERRGGLRRAALRDALVRGCAHLAGRAGPSGRGPARRRDGGPGRPLAAPTWCSCWRCPTRSPCTRCCRPRAWRCWPSPFSPPWGGCRFFCVDPDGYLVEIEQPA